MKSKFALPALAVSAALAAAGGLSYAGPSGGAGSAAADAARAKIPLAQAALAAEVQSRGRATSVDLEQEDGRVVYWVKILTADGKFLEVEVDAVSGKVVSSEPYQDDGSDECADDSDAT